MPSRHLSCLVAAILVFLLISSSLSLIEFSDNSLTPMSVFQFISLDSAPASSKSDANGDTEGSRVLEVERSENRSTIVSKVDSQGPDTKNVKEEPERYRRSSCDKQQALLRVYMYDLPPEFHFGLLGWRGNKNQIWPNVNDRNRTPSYPGGLNLQHSAEYWLTLDLLASNTENVIRPCSAIRVKDSSEADVIFVPFFSSLSYNRHSKRHGKQNVSVDRLLQERLVLFLKGQKEWKQFGGRNHLILAHHPNSMLVAREKLGSAMFVLADFGRYPTKIANIEKDVIAPYKHMVRTIPAANSPSFSERPILVYFQGAIYRKDGGAIRQELFYLLKDEKDVHFTFGSVQAHGIRKAGKGMATSKFCLNIAGDTPSSNRLFDAIASHCVPVIISDEIELPYEDVLDYSEFCIFIRASDAVKKGYLLNLLRGIKQEEWTKMWEKLKELVLHFEYQYPSQPTDAVDMIWQTVYRKKTPTQLDLHRRSRYHRSQSQ